MRFFAIAVQIFILIISSSLVSAQSQSAFWNGLSTTSKMTYLAGFQNGIVIAENDRIARDVHACKQCGTMVPILTEILSSVIGAGNEASLIRGVDAIYSDYRNESFSIKAALTIVALEISGTTPELIEAMKVECRQSNIISPGADYMGIILIMREKGRPYPTSD